MKPRRKNPSRPYGGLVIPSDATASDRRKVMHDLPEEDHIVDYVNDLGSGESRHLLIRDGGWAVDVHSLDGRTRRRRFSSREDAARFIHSRTPQRNPDWHAIGASAKDKAKRAHEWSKPHAAKAWEATKSGARKAGAATKRGAKKAAPHVARGIRSVSERLDRWAVANPDIGDAEIRRRVASEASTMREHRSMATAYRAEVERALVRRNRMAADFYARMADGHSSMAHALAGVASARRR
jgi:hypothetical protein